MAMKHRICFQYETNLENLNARHDGSGRVGDSVLVNLPATDRALAGNEIIQMKTSTTIIIITAIAAVFSVGIAIVDKQWTMDAFWPLRSAGKFGANEKIFSPPRQIGDFIRIPRENFPIRLAVFPRLALPPPIACPGPREI